LYYLYYLVYVLISLDKIFLNSIKNQKAFL